VKERDIYREGEGERKRESERERDIERERHELTIGRSYATTCS